MKAKPRNCVSFNGGWEKLSQMYGTRELWRFECDDAAGALANRELFIAYLKRHQGWSLDLYAARVIFTELVTNVMRHASGPVRLALEYEGRELALRITDRGPGFSFDPRLPADTLSEGGRGLFLVSEFAAAVRVEHAARSGTSVTAILPRTQPVPSS